jgi:hypothetical protein
MGLHDEAKLDRKFLEFAKLMNVYLNHFPKHEKYGLTFCWPRRRALSGFSTGLDFACRAALWRP